MNDDLGLDERPDAAQVEANRAEIIAFREANPTLTRTGLAVAFVEKRGSATSGELATLLDLRPDQYPSVELSSAVQNGRLARESKVWRLGPRKVAYEKLEPAEKPDALQTGAEMGKLETKQPVDVPCFAEKRAGEPRSAAQALIDPKPVPVKVPSSRALSRCRFAVWSDGQVEIKKMNFAPLELTPEEFDELSQFVGRSRA